MSRRRDLRVTDRSQGAMDEVLVTVDDPRPPVKGEHVFVGRPGRSDPAGRQPVEVVVDGWRFEFVVEDARRAELRDRASRDRSGHHGAGERLEIRAIIPGRIASVVVTPGDEVELGQTLLAVEAMKMQNELRAPRAGTVARVGAAPGSTVEVGDILIILE